MKQIVIMSITFEVEQLSPELAKQEVVDKVQPVLEQIGKRGPDAGRFSAVCFSTCSRGVRS